MEEGDGAMMGNDILALNYSQKTGVVDGGSVDLVGRLKTLSSGRKKLMTKYFDLEEVESGPLLAEYFAVSLAFVALGAMIREANVRMRRKDKENNSDGVSPKLQRMALDSMLKSAMERLRALALRTQSLEEKVRDRSYMEAAFQFERLEFLKRISGLEATVAKHEVTIANYEAATSRQQTAMAKTVEAETVWRREKEDLVKRMSDVDAQRGYFFKKMAEAESALAELQRLRMEDGKANAKLVEIYAGREQSWKSERTKMRHEIELLKEKLMCKVHPNMNSPRSFDATAEALRMRNLKRRAKEMVREKVVTEREFAALVESNPKSELDPRPPVGADERKDLECDIPELSAAQNQEMEAELAIILKRVGALKKRGASGGKLDELLNEAKGKPKLKRLGSFDQPPRSMVIDDTFQSKDVEIDKEDARDIWQAIEVHEGKSLHRRNGYVDSPRPAFNQPVADDQLRMSVLDSMDPLTSEKTSAPEKCSSPEESTNPRTPDWLTVVENDRDVVTDAVNSDEPIIHIDDGGWEEFLQENPSSSPKDSSVRESWEELVDEKPEINSSSERDGWEEFIQEKLSTLEDNICERTPVAVELLERWDQDSTVACAEPGSPVGLDDLILFEDDIKSEIFSEVLREHPQTAEASASEIDLLSAKSGERPGISSAHDLPEDVIKSEIIVSSPTPTLDSGHLDTEVHEDELGKVYPTPSLDSGHLDTEVHEDELGKVYPTPTLDSSQLDTEVHEDELGIVNPTPTLDSGHLDPEVHEDELGKVNPTPALDSSHLDTEVHEDELGKVNPTPTLVSSHLDTEVHEDELGKVNPTPTLDSGHLDTEVHEDELGKVDAAESQIGDDSENGQGQTLEVAEEDLNNSPSPGRISLPLSTIQQLSPGRTIISGLELEHEELNGSGVATP